MDNIVQYIITQDIGSHDKSIFIFPSHGIVIWERMDGYCSIQVYGSQLVHSAESATTMAYKINNKIKEQQNTELNTEEDITYRN